MLSTDVTKSFRKIKIILNNFTASILLSKFLMPKSSCNKSQTIRLNEWSKTTFVIFVIKLKLLLHAVKVRIYRTLYIGITIIKCIIISYFIYCFNLCFRSKILLQWNTKSDFLKSKKLFLFNSRKCLLKRKNLSFRWKKLRVLFQIISKEITEKTI